MTSMGVELFPGEVGVDPVEESLGFAETVFAIEQTDDDGVIVFFRQNDETLAGFGSPTGLYTEDSRLAQ